MPVVTIAKSTGVTAALGNRRLDTLLGSQSPVTGWVQGLTLQSPDTNTEDIKIGSSLMTSTDYDILLHPGDSFQDGGSEGNVMLGTRYVRSDGATDQSLNIRFESS